MVEFSTVRVVLPVVCSDFVQTFFLYIGLLQAIVSPGFIMVVDARPYEHYQSREVCRVRQIFAGRVTVVATTYEADDIFERSVEFFNITMEPVPPFYGLRGESGPGLPAKCKADLYHVALSDHRPLGWIPFCF